MDPAILRRWHDTRTVTDADDDATAEPASPRVQVLILRHWQPLDDALGPRRQRHRTRRVLRAASALGWVLAGYGLHGPPTLGRTGGLLLLIGALMTLMVWLEGE